METENLLPISARLGDPGSSRLSMEHGLRSIPAWTLDKFIEDYLLPDTTFGADVKSAVNVVCDFLKERCFQGAAHPVRVSKVVKVSPPLPELTEWGGRGISEARQP